MVEIKERSKEFNKVQEYLMTLSPAIITLNNVEDGEKIDVAGYMIYEDEKSDGTVAEIMSIITPQNQVYSCQSATFKRSLKDIAGIMAGEPFGIVKVSGVTKGGRSFINCILDLDTVNI